MTDGGTPLARAFAFDLERDAGGSRSPKEVARVMPAAGSAIFPSFWRYWLGGPLMRKSRNMDCAICWLLTE
jgi:hypothetical protein